MNPFWSMSTSSVRKRPDAEEKTLSGELRTSPLRASTKKQLPSIPKNAVPITKPASPAMSSQSTNGTHASYGPFYLEYSLLAEFTLVVKQKLPGVYVQPSYRSALMWFGVIFIRHGLYQDGVFKFTVYIPDNYPDGDCPRLVFDLPVFHPLVDPLSGELDVKRAFAKWRRNHNHIWQVLMYARRVFYKIDTTTPLNPEAAVLYEKDIQLFKSKVVDSVKLCSSHLFDQPKIEDPYAIIFSPWNPAIHDEAREKMLTQKIYQYRKEGKTCGSWKKASDSFCCSCCQLCDDMCRKTFCPSLSSVPTMGKQKEAQTFWSSCLVPQLFLEKLVQQSLSRMKMLLREDFYFILGDQRGQDSACYMFT